MEPPDSSYLAGRHGGPIHVGLIGLGDLGDLGEPRHHLLGIGEIIANCRPEWGSIQAPPMKIRAPDKSDRKPYDHRMMTRLADYPPDPEQS